jgi:hypothetical protein
LADKQLSVREEITFPSVITPALLAAKKLAAVRRQMIWTTAID